jgi:EmrB/QacA subfamily drug resistance transporter
MHQFTLTEDRRRWLGLAIVCLAQLMIVLDTTIVNVALPTIQHDLHFTQGNLTWVVNAFLVTFGSFLLLAGRLSDLLGRRRLFLLGLTVFTTASVICGLAPNQGVLIGARLVQGVGAALQASVILAIIVTEFPQPQERAKAMSAYVFTAVAGGSLGLLVGGALTQALSWHWIFFVNLPIGLGTMAAAHRVIRRDSGLGLGAGVDWLGSLLVTVSLMIAIYGIVGATSDGWGSTRVLGSVAVAAILLAAFVLVESRVAAPIMPLGILRIRRLIGGSVVRALLVPGMYATFFLGTLYLEQIRHFGAVETGLAFLPWTLTVAALSLGATARLVRRFGELRVVMAGMATVIAGLILLTHVGPTTGFFPTLFVAFLAIGLGVGSAFTPLMTLAMADVPAAEAGLGSGLTNLSQQVGGALGLAALGTLAASRTRSLAAAHVRTVEALIGGYHLAFTIGAGSVAAGLVVATIVLRTRPVQARAERDLTTEVPEPALESPLKLAGEVLEAALSTDPGIRRRFVLPVVIAPAPETGETELEETAV